MSDQTPPTRPDPLSLRAALPRVQCSILPDDEPTVLVLHGAPTQPRGFNLGPVRARELAAEIMRIADECEAKGWHRGSCTNCGERMRERRGWCWFCQAEDARQRRASFRVITGGES